MIKNSICKCCSFSDYMRKIIMLMQKRTLFIHFMPLYCGPRELWIFFMYLWSYILTISGWNILSLKIEDVTIFIKYSLASFSLFKYKAVNLLIPESAMVFIWYFVFKISADVDFKAVIYKQPNNTRSMK